MIRALPGLDVLCNPDSKWIWAKVDNGGDDSGYEIISDTEDSPDIPDEVLAALVEAKTSGAIIKESGTRPGRTRKVDPRARWDDDDELLPTEHYAEHGIPHGLQEDRFYRLADRFAAQGVTEAEGTRQLLAIARECEQDDRNPWTGDQLKEKMTRAIAWVATLLARKVPGEADGSPGRVLPSAKAPMRVARQIAEEDLATPQGLPSLRWHRGGFARWDGTAWPTEKGKAVEDAVRKQLYEITEHAMIAIVNDEGKRRLFPWNPDPRKIADLLEALGIGVLQLPYDLEPPFWITSGAGERGLIPMANGLLDFRTRELTPHTPDLFNAWSLPYDYDPDAPEPAEWLRFLGQLWPDKPESIDFLQELAGYLASGDTSQEKITLMIGARRGGKGTVCKVLTALLGEQNVASPTFASLTEQFGLAPLIGKPLAIISDARIGGRDIQAAVEKLLTISGRDRLPVNRKYKSMWEGQLPTRLVIVSNELFALRDASTALASRCIPLNYTKSWLNREDTGLGARLTTPRELSRILPWALDGLDRLRKQGKFTMPAGAAETLAALERLASPEKAWAEDHCEFGPGFWERTEYLHGAFELWAANEQRMKSTPNREVFAKNLRAAYPELVYMRRRSEEDGEDKKQHPGYRGIKLIRS
jgi:putative DNA primase/helicase